MKVAGLEVANLS